MGSVKDIARHFALRLAYALALWGAQTLAVRVFRLKRRERAAGGQQRQAPVKPPSAPTRPAVKVLHHPLQDYKPSNPLWLAEIVAEAEGTTDWPNAAHAPTAVPAWQCPLLLEFQAKVLAGQFNADTALPPLPSAPSPSSSSSLQRSGARPQPALVGPGQFSRAMELYSLDTTYTYLNHGSYGASFRLCSDVGSWYRQQLEGQPVRFMEEVAPRAVLAGVTAVAPLIGVRPQDCVPVTNATTAASTVLACLHPPLRRGDLVMCFNTTYPAVRHALVRAAGQRGAGVMEVAFSMEDLMSPGCMGAVAALRNALTAAGRRRLRLVVLDHVVSFPPVVMPVAPMAEACKQAGAQVFVDGAHALGSLPPACAGIPSLGPIDFYTANLHKWLCAPKGAAVLWVTPSRQAHVRPLVTSHGYGLGFRGEFLWQGTCDAAAWMSAGAAVAMFGALGLDRVLQYNCRLLECACTLLHQRWGTSLHLGGPPLTSTGPTATIAMAVPHSAVSSTAESPAEKQQQQQQQKATAVSNDTPVAGPGEQTDAGCTAGSATTTSSSSSSSSSASASGVPFAPMSAVQLPPLEGFASNAGDAARLNRLLRERFRIEVPVIAALGSMWVRISCQVYNSLPQYQALADAIDTLRPT